MNRKILFNTFAILIAALLLSSSGCKEPITPNPPETKDPITLPRSFEKGIYGCILLLVQRCEGRQRQA